METLGIGQSTTVVIAEGNFAKSGNFNALDAETYTRYFVSGAQMKKLGFTPENEKDIKFPLFATIKNEEIPVPVRDPKTREIMRDPDTGEILLTGEKVARLTVKAIYKTLEEQGDVIAENARAKGYLEFRREEAKSNVGKSALANATVASITDTAAVQ